ncbi:hypothetical protein [Tepidibacter hydrothermalis]|uniref:DUF4258 domain-containing protein n=1 Tax=Tepidibacter hydrothermalis TaxID=3036126 RepID=A0ABY8E793_9FIRM|nr:hypothetical protein [Tepidibacter hydrothermalis]WFD08768.1 hypothetical protein P4S50_10195 [Tepidibacter hydrothermalis]
MNEHFIVFIAIIVFFTFLKLISETEEDGIRYRIEKMGGKILSIEQDKSYIKEADKIEKKKRLYTDTVFKVKYNLDSKDRIVYVVIYRSYFMMGRNSWKRDWIEKP